MSSRKNLENDLKRYKEDLRVANALKDIEVLPSFKLVRDKYIKELSAAIIHDLHQSTGAEREKDIQRLVGISSFQEYLTYLQQKGEEAKQNIQATHAAITNLEETNHE